MGGYNPKTKGLPTAWRGMQWRLPKTLSTFQIVILGGVLSLLILRSTIGLANFKFSGHYTVADDEYAKEEQSWVLDTADVEPKRNLVQPLVDFKLFAKCISWERSVFLGPRPFPMMSVAAVGTASTRMSYFYQVWRSESGFQGLPLSAFVSFNLKSVVCLWWEKTTFCIILDKIAGKH